MATAAEQKVARRQHVANLSGLARKYGLVAVHRDAPLDVLRRTYRELAMHCHPDKGGSEKDMQDLNGVSDFFKGFVDNRRVAAPVDAIVHEDARDGAGRQVCVPVKKKRRQLDGIVTPGVMFTHNGDFLGDHKNIEDVEKDYRNFVVEFLGTLGGVRYYSATLELSLRTNKTVTLSEVFGCDAMDETDFQRIHMHLFAEFADTQLVDPDLLREQATFMGSKPHMVFSAAKGRIRRKVLDRSHFYVRAEKVGTLLFFGNYYPWTEWAPGGAGNYRVEGKWVDDLWSEHKLACNVYLRYAELIRVDFPKRKAWCDAVTAQLRTRRLEAEVQRREEQLRKQYSPWKKFVVFDEWKEKCSRLTSRYDIFVVRAGSKSGKTEWAKAQFDSVWEQVIEDLPAPNFRTYLEEEAVLLDNVNDATFILRNRGLLMARNTVHQLSQTATGLFTYPCYLHRVPIMITMDIEKVWPDSDWLKANCVLLELAQGEKMYATDDAGNSPDLPESESPMVPAAGQEPSPAAPGDADVVVPAVPAPRQAAAATAGRAAEATAASAPAVATPSPHAAGGYPACVDVVQWLHNWASRRQHTVSTSFERANQSSDWACTVTCALLPISCTGHGQTKKAARLAAATLAVEHVRLVV